MIDIISRHRVQNRLVAPLAPRRGLAIAGKRQYLARTARFNTRVFWLSIRSMMRQTGGCVRPVGYPISRFSNLRMEISTVYVVCGTGSWVEGLLDDGSSTSDLPLWVILSNQIIYNQRAQSSSNYFLQKRYTTPVVTCGKILRHWLPEIMI